MVRAIWKFQLGVLDEQIVFMPEGAEILHLQVQRDVPCVWAIVDPDARQEPRKFWTIVTGDIPDDRSLATHIGSYQLEGGSFVAHVFEAPRA